MTEIKHTIGFNYGVLFDSLETQAKKQGYKLNDADKFEEIRKAINLCSFHVATDSQVLIMLKKLHKQVVGHLSPIE